MPPEQPNWDLFLSHASEDKNDFVRPLAHALNDGGVKAWYDEFEVGWGDSVRESIDHGLKNSKFAMVVLSPSYFKKSWTSNELSAYFSLESRDAKRILPIWHRVSRDEVIAYSPLLADRQAASSEQGIDSIVQKARRRLSIGISDAPEAKNHERELLSDLITWNSLSEYTRKKFPRLQVHEYWQAELLDDIKWNPAFKSIGDIDRAVAKASQAVQAYSLEQPSLFETGTDFITKSLGFVDLDFRKAHSWSDTTRAALDRLSPIVSS